MQSEVGFGGSVKPKRYKDEAAQAKARAKRSKVYSFSIPGGLGRFAFTRDRGEGGLFQTSQLRSHLGAVLYAPDVSVRGQIRRGKIIDEYDLGSGLVTNIGVTALGYDAQWTAETTELINTLAACKWQQWGTGKTAAAQTDFKLQTLAENELHKKEGVEATNLLKWLATGNAKLISTATLTEEAAGPVEISEWGLFSAKNILGTEKTAVNAGANTATTFTDTGGLVAPGTEASGAKKRGAQNYVLFAKEAEEAYGLIEKNTTEVATVAGFSKAASAAEAAVPSKTSKYFILPVMFDHRVFAVINVEKGNKIEFPYELEIQGGH